MFASNTSQVANDAVFIEDTFACHLYTGNGSTQTITNGIDLAGKGGLVWTKCRSNAYSNYLIDTVQTKNKILVSNSTAAAITAYDSSYYGLTSFNSNGYSLGPDFTESLNTSGGKTFASWTFRKQPKFFDVVTYTGNGNNTQTISHNLGSTPGCIITKLTSGSDSWRVYHRSLSTSDPGIKLNSTAAGGNSPYDYGDQSTVTSPTSTQFTAGININASGSTYVAYLFAHNAGGFGLTGTDNVISCGSAADGNSLVTLGYEPQWVLIKGSQGSIGVGDNWLIADAMRGMVYSGNTPYLAANLSSAEDFSGGGGSWIKPTATGFQLSNLSGTGPFIYIAIRRGPMKVPTSGTSVFLPTSRTGNASLTTITSGFAPDVVLSRRVDNLDNGNESVFADKLRGTGTLSTVNYAAEYAGGATSGINAYTNTGIVLGINNNPIYAFNYATLPYATYQFQRAPNFFDEVCYTGTGSATTVAHNLGVAPELIIIKKRSNTSDWAVLQTGVQKQLYLNGNYAGDVVNATYFGNDSVYVAPTSTVFSLGSSSGVNGVSGQTFVAYLFATCAGVSKVGSYTGTGTTKQVDCGFTGGARFVLIKKTSGTGSWYIWDSARGIVSGNDPYLLLNSTAAEVTNTDYIDTYSAGFEISSTAPSEINENGGSFIFLAIS